VGVATWVVILAEEVWESHDDEDPFEGRLFQSPFPLVSGDSRGLRLERCLVVLVARLTTRGRAIRQLRGNGTVLDCRAESSLK
jgi:hypothetical protein